MLDAYIIFNLQIISIQFFSIQDEKEMCKYLVSRTIKLQDKDLSHYKSDEVQSTWKFSVITNLFWCESSNQPHQVKGKTNEHCFNQVSKVSSFCAHF